MMTRERMHELIIAAGLPEYADEIVADARPSVHLTLDCTVDEVDIPVGASKMGGSPDVPDGFEYPMWKGQYLSFIAQIRLSDAKPYDLEDLLPESGMLYFFYENTQYILEHGLKDDIDAPYKVVYLPDEATPLNRIPHPVSYYSFDFQGETRTRGTEVYRGCPITFEVEWTPRCDGHKGSQQRSIEIYTPEYDRYWGGDGGWWWAVEEELAEPMHRLVGAETDIQTNFSMMQNASAAWELGTEDDWLLLLQVHTDDDTGFEWDDGGVIYFLIHRDDLKARRFDRVWLYFTSH